MARPLPPRLCDDAQRLFNQLHDADTRLPVLDIWGGISAALEPENGVAICKAATGAGKSTLLPILLSIAPYLPGSRWQGAPPQSVFITQPRAFSARPLVQRVRTLMSHDVMFRVEMWREDEVVERALALVADAAGGRRVPPVIVVLTESALLRLLGESGLSMPVSCVVMLDEAHERSAQMDCLMSLLGKPPNAHPQHKRHDKPPLWQQGGLLVSPVHRLVIASATVDEETVLRFLPHVPALVCEGRKEPCDIHPVNMVDGNRIADVVAYSVDLVFELLAEGLPKRNTHQYRAGNDGGTVLVFLPGQGECEEAVRVFRRLIEGWDNAEQVQAVDVPVQPTAAIEEYVHAVTAVVQRVPMDKVPVLPVALFGKLPPHMQDRVISTALPGRIVRIVFTTNVAETSVTLPDVAAVIDMGLEKISTYYPERHASILKAVQVSRSSRLQRAGRAGRTQPGKVFSVHWPGDSVEQRPDNDVEMGRGDLGHLTLRLRKMGVSLERLELPDPPNPVKMAEILQQLRQQGALDGLGRITDLGWRIASLPSINTSLGGIFLAAVENGYAVYGAAAIACLTVGAELLWWGTGLTTEEQAKILTLHAPFLSARSDVETLANIFLRWFSLGMGRGDVAGLGMNGKTAATAKELFCSLLHHGAGVAVPRRRDEMQRFANNFLPSRDALSEASFYVDMRLAEMFQSEGRIATLCSARINRAGKLQLLYAPQDSAGDRLALSRPALIFSPHDPNLADNIPPCVAYDSRNYIHRAAEKALTHHGFLGLCISISGQPDPARCVVRRVADVCVGLVGGNLKWLPAWNALSLPFLALFKALYPDHDTTLLYDSSALTHTDYISSTRPDSNHPSTRPSPELWAVGPPSAVEAACTALIKTWWLWRYKRAGELSTQPDIPARGQVTLLREDIIVGHVRLAGEDGAPPDPNSDQGWLYRREFHTMGPMQRLLGGFSVQGGPSSWPEYSVVLDTPAPGGFTLLRAFRTPENDRLFVSELPVGEGGNNTNPADDIGGGPMLNSIRQCLLVCVTRKCATLVAQEPANCGALVGSGLKPNPYQPTLFHSPVPVNALQLRAQATQLWAKFKQDGLDLPRDFLPTSLKATSPKAKREGVNLQDGGVQETIRGAVVESAAAAAGGEGLLRLSRSWSLGSDSLFIMLEPTAVLGRGIQLENWVAALTANLTQRLVDQSVTVQSSVQYDVMLRGPAKAHLLVNGLMREPTSALRHYGVVISATRCYSGVRLSSLNQDALCEAIPLVVGLLKPRVPLLAPQALAYLLLADHSDKGVHAVADRVQAISGPSNVLVALDLPTNRAGAPPRVAMYCGATVNQQQQASHVVNDALCGLATDHGYVVVGRASPLCVRLVGASKTREFLAIVAADATIPHTVTVQLRYLASARWACYMDLTAEPKVGCAATEGYNEPYPLVAVCHKKDKPMLSHCLATLDGILKENDGTREKVRELLGMRRKPRGAADTCYSVCGVSPAVHTLHCGHTLCVECVEQLVANVTGEAFTPLVVGCSATGCDDRRVTLRELTDVLSFCANGAELLRRWTATAARVTWLSTNQNCFECPGEGCKRYLWKGAEGERAGPGRVVLCGDCGSRVCVACGRLEHPQRMCNGDPQVEEVPPGTRRCPRCNILCALEDGCNAVTCRCGCHFCIRCGWHDPVGNADAHRHASAAGHLYR